MSKKEIIKKGIELYNKYYPNDKHTTIKEKTAFVNFFIDLHKLQNRTIKVLQSKVKTYEADINKRPEFVYSKAVNFLKRNIK